MKRELKASSVAKGPSDSIIARPIPMKRELKEEMATTDHRPYHHIARPIPMKRELKDIGSEDDAGVWWQIARPIPMKRELKGVCSYVDLVARHANRKAHPDEKGTES